MRAVYYLLAVCATCSRVRWYTDDPVYDTILLVALLLPPVTVLASRFLNAPYGKYGESWPWGKLSGRLGWFLMELPATLVFWPAFLTGPRACELVPALIAGIWGVHYFNRGFLFPLMMRVPRGSRTFGIFLVAFGMMVTTLHGYLSGYYLSRYADHLTPEWLCDGRFIVGLALYIGGLALNVHADAMVRRLRSREEVARGTKVYRIPRGGGYHFVSNPQYLGELVLWTGYALLTGSLAGVFILALSAANLVPRAIANHRWYVQKFPDYPRHRKILVPFLF
jgi:3-oxo-5-alpha-steroid 4-dehydrogenase 1